MARDSRDAAVAQYDAKAGYESTASGARVALFIEAARVMLRYGEGEAGPIGT